jgi:hypothetical protein
MSVTSLLLDHPSKPGVKVPVTPDPQSVVTPGDDPGTAVVLAPDGTRTQVSGDPADVHLKIQAAAAHAHQSGQIEVANTPVN